MCDEHTVEDDAEFLQARGQGDGIAALSRRGFAALSVGALAGCTSMGDAGAEGATDVAESEVEITTPDGACDAYFVHPSKGKHAAVLVWPDIMGLRPAFRMMGKRLAHEGYSVLVVNPYYRTQKGAVLSEGESFSQPAVRERLMPMARSLNAETNATDANAFINWLDKQSVVDTGRKVGTTGYCMGGPFTMRTAAARPDRVGAGGSFHGGGVATDQPNSPHHLVPKMKASFLFAIAQNDDERDPQMKVRLREAYDAADLPAEIEVYPAQHGWCALDSAVYDEAQAEKAHARLVALLKTALA
ncbi:MAG: dienelactone hydrolase family protein [Hyphomonadaceae bacterium]